MTEVRTRFAPSPTGFLHIGGARTALFSWAYARHHGGKFILRVEDTDLERSTEAAVEAIFDGMRWLDLDWDEGPFFQTQRMDRYRQVIRQLLDEGKAYHCYCTKDELDAMRQAQQAAGAKPRYDGRCREREEPRSGVEPVIRFKNPGSGSVLIRDLIKGDVVVANSELDDLIIARSDGSPTYNFCVVVDDWDMGITHVIRGDDHLNNTPRQINILQALGAPIPFYAHVPMILGHDGEKLSKRHGAVSVTQYREDGYLPEAIVNYLGRLGWGHGDAEIFSRDEYVGWFDLGDVSRSASRFDPEKLDWLNQHYIKEADNRRLEELVMPFMFLDGCHTDSGPELNQVIGLVKERVSNIKELADAAVYFYRPLEPTAEVRAEHLGEESLALLASVAEEITVLETWTQEAIAAFLKAFAKGKGVKFPKVAMPLRVAVTGEPHTPPIDAVLELLGKEETLRRLEHCLKAN